MCQKGLDVSTEGLYPMRQYDIGWAIAQMRDGKLMCRAGWSERGIYVVLMTALRLQSNNSQKVGAKVNDRIARFVGKSTPLAVEPYIALMNAQGHWQPGWVCSQADLLATDWEAAE